MQLPDVIGVAVSRSSADPERACILVYYTGSDWPTGLPRELDGVPVELQFKTKGFRAL